MKSVIDWNHVILGRTKYKGATIYKKRHPIANDNEFYYQVEGLVGELYGILFYKYKPAKDFIKNGFVQ